MSDDYDLVVIGAGAAGLTAARHAAAGGAHVIVIDQLGVGGQVSTVEGITNFPGRPEPIAGYDLGVTLLEEAEAVGAEVVLSQVRDIVADEGGFVVDGSEGELRTRAVIVAAGSERRALDAPGERELEGQGVSRCASCDGPFFREKRVVVVGGGDSALDEAQILADFASEVVVVHHGPTPTARPEIAVRAAARPNIRFRPDATVSAIRGEGGVQAVAVRDLTSGVETEERAEGVFVYVGLIPNTEWLADLLDRDTSGHLVVDAELATSRRGVFAAGDIRSGTAAMLEESVADGWLAARSALAYLAETAAASAARAKP